MKKGFTLIELLVVVLIIGILAAIALPQYNIAVEKSRAAEAFTSIRALTNAVQVWGLANGNDYDVLLTEKDPFSVLDVSLPLEKFTGSSVPGLKSKNFVYMLEKNVEGYITVRAYGTKTKLGDGHNDFAYHLPIQTWRCVGRTELGKKVCKSYGGTLVYDQIYNLPM